MTEAKKKGKAKRGFASMSLEKRREIARKGGQSIPPEKRSYSVNRKLAAAAGKKGGVASGEAKRQRIREWVEAQNQK